MNHSQSPINIISLCFVHKMLCCTLAHTNAVLCLRSLETNIEKHTFWWNSVQSIERHCRIGNLKEGHINWQLSWHSNLENTKMGLSSKCELWGLHRNQHHSCPCKFECCSLRTDWADTHIHRKANCCCSDSH